MAQRRTEDVGELERELQAIAQRLEVGKRQTGRSNSEMKPRRLCNGPPKQVHVTIKPLTRNHSSVNSAQSNPMKVSDSTNTRPSIRDRIQAVLNAPTAPPALAPVVVPQQGYSFSSVPRHVPHLSQGNPSVKPTVRSKALTPVKLQIAFPTGCDWSRILQASGNL